MKAFKQRNVVKIPKYPLLHKNNKICIFDYFLTILLITTDKIAFKNPRNFSQRGEMYFRAF